MANDKYRYSDKIRYFTVGPAHSNEIITNYDTFVGTVFERNGERLIRAYTEEGTELIGFATVPLYLGEVVLASPIYQKHTRENEMLFSFLIESVLCIPVGPTVVIRTNKSANTPEERYDQPTVFAS